MAEQTIVVYIDGRAVPVAAGASVVAALVVAAPLLSVAPFADVLTVQGSGRGGKLKEETIKGATLASHQGKRARKGRQVDGLQKVLRLA